MSITNFLTNYCATTDRQNDDDDDHLSRKVKNYLTTFTGGGKSFQHLEEAERKLS